MNAQMTLYSALTKEFASLFEPAKAFLKLDGEGAPALTCYGDVMFELVRLYFSLREGGAYSSECDEATAGSGLALKSHGHGQLQKMPTQQ